MIEDDLVGYRHRAIGSHHDDSKGGWLLRLMGHISHRMARQIQLFQNASVFHMLLFESVLPRQFG